MRSIFRSTLFRGLIFLCLGATAAWAQEQTSAQPPSAEAQALITKLRTLRVPETVSFLKTVDPKVFAEALKTSDGGCAMMLASRWSTRRPDTRTNEGGIAVKEFVEKLGKEFALLPQPILYALVNWKVKTICPDLDIPDEEEQQLLDTQDALRAGYFLGQLTPEQQEAVYELQDLQNQHDRNQTGLAEIKRDYYTLFTGWGPAKLRHVLEGRWSAAEFCKAFGELFFMEKMHWKLSAMPSWFWQELVRFTEGPNAFPAISLLPNRFPSSGSEARWALGVLSVTLKNERMHQAVEALSDRIGSSSGGQESE